MAGYRSCVQLRVDALTRLQRVDAVGVAVQGRIGDGRLGVGGAAAVLSVGFSRRVAAEVRVVI